VAQLPLPRPRIIARVRAEAPALADLVGRLLADELFDPAVHRAIAGGEDDQVGGQFAAVGEDERALQNAFDADAAFELDAAVGDKIARANVDIETAATTQSHYRQARSVLAEIELEAGLL